MSIYATSNLRILTEPERKVFESGTYITRFYGGSYEGKDKDGNYIDNAIDVKVWGKQGDILFGETALVGKGDTVTVNGKVLMEKWDDADGKSRSKHIVEASRIELLPRAEGGAPAPARQAPAPKNSSPFGGSFGEEEVGEDEIPF
jgi:single-stranded DNA-binding protein